MVKGQSFLFPPGKRQGYLSPLAKYKISSLGLKYYLLRFYLTVDILKVLPDSGKGIRLDLGMTNGYLGTKDSSRSFGSLPATPHVSTVSKFSPVNESPTQRTS